MPTLTPAPLRGNFVMLRAETLRLLLPQTEVGAAEYLEIRPEPTAEPGHLALPDEAAARRFVAMSAQMTLLPHCPADRFVVAAIGDSCNSPGWCWDELQVLIDVELQPQPLPAVLLAAETPVDGYAEHSGEIAYLCSARRLAEFALKTRN